MTARRGGRAAALQHRFATAGEDMLVIIRPTGLLYGKDATAALDQGRAFALAGSEVVFTQAEYVRRAGTSVLERRMVTAEELATVASFDGFTRDRLDRLISPRPPFSGLTFEQPRIAGILNITPDSFSDGDEFLVPGKAVDHARRMKEDGADFLDIGGESTRPGAHMVTAQEEMDRVIPVLEALKMEGLGPLSIDTRNAEVMKAAIAAGVNMINDVSALTHDPASPGAVAASGLPVILMHAQGTPETMQNAPGYEDVVLDVFAVLETRIRAAVGAGIDRSRIIVDPGIGFGKTQSQNFELLQSLTVFHGLGCPVMLGASRKSFMKDLPGGAAAQDRSPGTIAATLWGCGQGVQIHRVHDVAPVKQAMTLHERLTYTQ